VVVGMSGDVVARMQRLQEDHGPAGWPAVHMSDITALLAEVERLSLVVRHLNGQVDHLGIRLGEVMAERDGLRTDAGRYRWLRDIGNASWIPLVKRWQFAHEADAVIDEAMKDAT
jgi:hypothetical protein